jgi:hypothetical protein
MRAARAGQLVKARQRAELVVGRLGVQAARQPHRAGKGLRRIAVGARQFGLPEAPVERRVVRHQRRVAHETARLRHHLGRWRRIGHHGVGDAGELCDERRNAHPGVHQALELATTRPPSTSDGHLGGARALGGCAAGGLEVDDGDGRGHEQKRLKRLPVVR